MRGIDDRVDPSKYISFIPDNKKVKTTFGDQYRTDPKTALGGQYPWDPGRFNTEDILNRVQAKKRTLNQHLGVVDPAAPLENQLFVGLGRFVRHENYDFKKGEPLTNHRPQDNPDYNPIWIQAYKISPTIPPEKRFKNPMPSAANPDPHGYIMKMGEDQAENTVNPLLSVASLLTKSKTPDTSSEDTSLKETSPSLAQAPYS